MSDKEFAIYEQALTDLLTAFRRVRELRTQNPDGLEDRVTPEQKAKLLDLEKGLDEVMRGP